MDYISAQEAAEKWGVTKRRVQLLCASNRIENVTRVGNMWIIPADAQKPYDSRYKDKKATKDIHHKTPIRLARNQIRSISTHGMTALMGEGHSSEMSKSILVAIFTYGLLCHYLSQSSKKSVLRENNDILKSVSSFFEIRLKISKTFREIYTEVIQFIEEYSFCCDDALSWCYQFANKFDSSDNYSNTQFFTEKYMITTIVDSIDVTKRKKIFDPACGGGNFLLYCIDSFCNNTVFPKNDKSKCKNIINQILEKHYGYEIDFSLSVVSSVNMRLKCLSVLCNLGYDVDISDFYDFSPNIYYPIEETVGGALDIKKHKQLVSKVKSEEHIAIDRVFESVDAMVTNPPFQTIKGMNSDLKQYLKVNYPLSKCDMCNAFIELAKSIVVEKGIVGMVTQNSWMYLDSFIEFRKNILSSYSIDKIWELGSNAFFDLNGEKSNVALVVFRNNNPTKYQNVTLSSLKTLSTEQIEKTLSLKSTKEEHVLQICQNDILNSFESRFDMVSSRRLRELVSSEKHYENFAVPMQGTSTGNAKELIDYFWKHQNDSNWKLVSKGGGYSRWQGLNHYSVIWGNNGEYIKKQKGSAIRNANYFNQTQMVFSDTGTSGLNVRNLQDGQIFVASGPGIRIKQGSPYAHLAFLNSRLASYYIKLLSPKLTIAAGYISKIPTNEELLNSEVLEKSAKLCINAKKRRLSKRPFNTEFVCCTFSENSSIEEQARQWFLDDIQSEWEQLQQEQLIDQYIFSVMKITEEDIKIIDEFIGEKKVLFERDEPKITSEVLSYGLEKSLDSNCNIVRTKSEKKRLGCDGILEYLSQVIGASCESIYNYFLENNYYPEVIKSQYENLLIHSVLMSEINYLIASKNIGVSSLIKHIRKPKNFDVSEFRTWIISSFNIVHSECFCKNPIFVYNPTSDEIELIKEKQNE